MVAIATWVSQFLETCELPVKQELQVKQLPLEVLQAVTKATAKLLF